ncbi:Na+/H+ antiporter NhaC family protein [Pontiellaceae bacterium B1224]|nr:Na+/H+ antiporter NhaC family protein [Pontiellaceae bacterium B1224]
MKIRFIIVMILFLGTWLVGLSDAPWIALWPSVVALASVFILSRTILGLLLGMGAGLVLLADGNPVMALGSFFTVHLLPVFSSTWNLSVLAFTLLLGGFAALLERGGGIQALMQKGLLSGSHSGKRVQWSAYMLGLICFFDGLANCMLVGKSMSPMAKRAGVSKARLAYIVDSTSSAVACVAVISTWIAYQLAMIREGLLQADVEAQPFGLFLKSIPFNYYCWFTLILLAVVVSRDWNIGPMRKREMGIRLVEPVQQDFNGMNKTTAWSAVVPLGFLILGLLIGLYLSGSQGNCFPMTLQRVSDAFGNANASAVLVWVSALACGIALFFNFKPIKSQGENPLKVFGAGIKNLFKPVLILVAAWLLSSTLKSLNATEVLTGLLQGNVAPGLFSLLVFVTGALISFSTGTSWGTMGILMPLALPVALSFSGGELSPLIHGTIAAVFSGAVFGDHCSPFSDTTIVSSISCGTEPMEHVKTQMPYALIAASVSILIGFLPSGLGVNPFGALLIGAVVLFALPIVSNAWKKQHG